MGREENRAPRPGHWLARQEERPLCCPENHARAYTEDLLAPLITLRWTDPAAARVAFLDLGYAIARKEEVFEIHEHGRPMSDVDVKNRGATVVRLLASGAATVLERGNRLYLERHLRAKAERSNALFELRPDRSIVLRPATRPEAESDVAPRPIPAPSFLFSISRASRSSRRNNSFKSSPSGAAWLWQETPRLRRSKAPETCRRFARSQISAKAK